MADCWRELQTPDSAVETVVERRSHGLTVRLTDDGAVVIVPGTAADWRVVRRVADRLRTTRPSAVVLVIDDISVPVGAVRPLATVGYPVIAALRGTVSLGAAAVADLRIGSRSTTAELSPGESCVTDDGWVTDDDWTTDHDWTTDSDWATDHDWTTDSDWATDRLRAIAASGTVSAGSVGTDRLLAEGLVNAAVPAETTVGTATALAHRLLDREPWLYRYLKRALDTATEPREPTAESPSANTREATVESSSHSEADQTVSVDEPRPALYRITLDRRTRLNAITDRMTRELFAAVRTVADRDPTAVVVRGRGRRAFSVGLDLDAPVAADREAAAAAATRLQTVTDSLATLDAPTVCVLTGYALGGGLELALAADSRVATPDTEVGFPEVTHGAVPAAGGTQRAPLCVGRGRATELLFLGCRYTVDATAVTTLTDIVVPPERLPEAALDTAEALARTESSDRPRANDGVAAAEGLAVELAGLRRWSSE